MLPLVGDLAPPHRRSSALSIVVAGLSLGMMVARVLSGIVSNYTYWRNIYWVALGLQGSVLAALWVGMPHYPSKNPEGLNYLRVIWSIFTIFASEPVLIQACLVSFCMSATFTSYWTTLSFLLSSPPYGFSPLQVGLFGLIGLFVIFWGPPFGRIVLDLLIPLVPALGGVTLHLVGVTIGTFTGTFTVAGPIVQAVLNDVANQSTNISLRTNIFGIDPKARNRVNTAYMLAAFCGQLTGTAVGNRLYAEGGWVWSGSCSSKSLPFA
jgi:predicted MFS family arabinose efflux permease